MRRREDTKIEPVSVVSTSLISRPVDPQTRAPHPFASMLTTARQSIERHAHEEGGAGSQRKSLERPPQRTSVSNLSILQSKDAADLYARLDTLLNEKSILIAIV